jgi:hypothetical protein
MIWPRTRIVPALLVAAVLVVVGCWDRALAHPRNRASSPSVDFTHWVVHASSQ